MDLGLVGWFGLVWSCKKASVEELETTVSWLDDGGERIWSTKDEYYISECPVCSFR